MRHLPVYLTETDQDDAWRNENNGWVQRAYGEIDWWNRQPGNQVIRAVILYRWPNVDKWGIDGKAGVIEDFRKAISFKYSWENALQTRPGTPPVVEPEKPKPEQPKPPVEPTKPPVQPPIEPARPVIDTSPIPFAATGKTAKGLFAAFYRQYGLDLTGYPITDEYVHPQSGLKTQEWQRLSTEEYQGAIRLRLVGQEAVELRAKIDKLERQIAQLQSGGGGPAEPTIVDIIAKLPRDAARFVKRPLTDIQYLVVNHTGVRPEVGADRVAQAQRAKWPGIVGQYFITADGVIQQTNPDDEVVTRDQAWIYNGINIYVAGNFDETVPNAAQMDALAQLCAWLLNKHSLAEGAIQGVSEFIVTRSPGLQWLKGQNWKKTLLEQVRAVPVGPGGPATPPPQPVDDGQLAALRDKVSQLQAQLADLQADLTASEAERARLQAQVEALLKGSSPTLTRPAITDVSPQLPRNPDSQKKRDVGKIKSLVINHTAVDSERAGGAHRAGASTALGGHPLPVSGDCRGQHPANQRARRGGRPGSGVDRRGRQHRSGRQLRCRGAQRGSDQGHCGALRLADAGVQDPGARTSRGSASSSSPSRRARSGSAAKSGRIPCSPPSRRCKRRSEPHRRPASAIPPRSRPCAPRSPSCRHP